jgi:nicotinate-nucleotide adenylyltransferase
MTDKRPLAILGGTFDPVHLGHLRAAWEASELLDAEVLLVPARVPPHRARPVASAEQRVAILRAALANQDRLGLDLRELRRDGPSYTIDTLASLRAEFGGRQSLTLLIGADAFGAFPSWHRWRELFDLAHVCVLTRAGHLRSLPGVLAEAVAARRATGVAELRSEAAGRVIELAVTPLDISATRVRALLAEGRAPRWLVPDALFDEPSLLSAYREAGPDTG